MSLDVHLKSATPIKKECYECGSIYDKYEELYWANITHNLGEMADKAGIYQALWRPEENGWITASDIIPILDKGLKDLKKRPKYFEKFNASNGWGIYEHFVPFVKEYLQACKANPDAIIEASR